MELLERFNLQRVTVIRPSCDIDLRQAARVREEITALIAKEQVRVVLDLSGVDFVAPLALGVLAALKADLVQMSGGLCIAGANAFITEIVKRYAGQAELESYRTIEDAIQSFDEEFEMDPREAVQ